MTQQNNESAFPWGDYEGLKAGQSGMSKQFYAACKAMEGWLSNPEVWNGMITYEQIAESAYKIADEMLKQENEK